ncbi:MAG TPA: lactate racemase domain-containing protein [Negativicutes bacterium]|nr:lactate racemase domain-containing protein [Negativicutes bacterium]
MDIIKELLKDVPLPRMIKIGQKFKTDEVTDVPTTLRAALANSKQLDRIKPGMRIAIAAGSRGVDQIPALIRTTVEELKKRGADPFVIPAMGSHGGATAEGQAEVLAHLGITEQTVGCPIISSMEVVEISRLPNGLPVYVDKNAYHADGIIVINRVKPHTAFRGPNESGLAKMIAIGLGKQKGAETCHAYGFKHMAEHVPAMAREAIAKVPILFGIGTVENAYDHIAKIVVASADALIEIDKNLLVEAKGAMPRIGFSPIDVLIIDEIGKDISGDGMDPNITGRYPTPYPTGGPEVSKMVVLDLTEKTNGNANGVGTANFTTRRLVAKTDFKAMYANGITSTVVGPTAIPLTLDCDLDAIRAAVKTSNALDISKVRLVRIKNTLQLGELMISESLLEEARAMPNVTILSDPFELKFNEQGNLWEK